LEDKMLEFLRYTCTTIFVMLVVLVVVLLVKEIVRGIRDSKTSDKTSEREVDQGVKAGDSKIHVYHDAPKPMGYQPGEVSGNPIFGFTRH